MSNYKRIEREIESMLAECPDDVVCATPKMLAQVYRAVTMRLLLDVARAADALVNTGWQLNHHEVSVHKARYSKTEDALTALQEHCDD